MSAKAYKCPEGQRFDSKTSSCLLADLATCSGGQAAEPERSGGADESPAEEASVEFFREQLGVVACSAPGPKAFEADCRHFYNCAQASAGAQLKGELLKCPAGREFSESSGKCVESSGACTKAPLNPLLFPPSPLIAEAREAGAQFQ